MNIFFSYSISLFCLFVFISCQPQGRGYAPDFSLKQLNGKQVSLNEMKGKKIVLLNFWATWCASCKKEIPLLNRLYHKYKHKDFEIIGISLDKNKEKLKEYIIEHKIQYPIVLGDSKIESIYRVTGVPESFLVNKRGLIYEVYIGPPSPQNIEQDIVHVLSAKR